MRVLEEALDREHSPIAQSILMDSIDLKEASTVGFQITADVLTEACEEHMRQNMTAPRSAFSGLFYAYHKDFVTGPRVLHCVPDDFKEVL